MSLKKGNPMEVTIYPRHSAKCKHKSDRYYFRCHCPLWFQFNWPHPKTILNGNNLRKGQNKWPASTRIMSEAQANAKRLETELAALLQGKPVHKNVTVEAAALGWLKFKKQNGLGTTKAEFMTDKLVAWCKENELIHLTALTTERAMEFRTSLSFRTGDSSSLSVHWAIINGFFSWAVGMGYLEKSPSPDTRIFPQFRIKFRQREVVPPTRQEMEKVLATAAGKVSLLVRLMRESGMALVDAHKFGMLQSDGEQYSVSRPERRPVLLDRTLIRGNRTKTNERYRIRISKSLAEQLEALGGPAFPGTYVKWREEVNKVIRQAGVKMTPHGFRHYRITELLAAGVRVEDVADMVGTSPKEIRKTYRHWIKEAEDRLDEVQRQAWLKQGLDENGDPKAQQGRGEDTYAEQHRIQ
jgi:integrase